MDREDFCSYWSSFVLSVVQKIFQCCMVWNMLISEMSRIGNDGDQSWYCQYCSDSATEHHSAWLGLELICQGNCLYFQVIASSLSLRLVRTETIEKYYYFSNHTFPSYNSPFKPFTHTLSRSVWVSTLSNNPHLHSQLRLIIK